ncbi:MAG: MFS transporter, partial [Pseudomonadota bacterium]
GLFYAAILKEYGWGRAEAAGAFSLMMIIHAMMAPLTGILIDRFGPRRIFPFAGVILALGLVTSSIMTQMWHLYVSFGVFAAIGTNMLSYAPHMSRVPRWFVRKKGLAVGLILSGTGTGTLILALLVGFIIKAWGWRPAFVVLGGLIFFVVVPITALFQRTSPEEVGQSLESIDPEPLKRAAVPAPEKGDQPSEKKSQKLWTFRAALRTLAFWCLAFIGFLQGMFLNTINVHLPVYILDKGFSPLLAASSVGLAALLASLGGILFGFFSDRMGREFGYAIGSGGGVVGIIFLLMVHDPSSVLFIYAFVLFYGLGTGGIISILAAATADLFPGYAMGKIISIQAVTFGIGSALGAYLGGFFYDRTGSYVIPLLIVLALFIINAAALWVAAPRKSQTALTA